MNIKKKLVTQQISEFLITFQLITLDFKNFAIFAFIHDKNKRRIIEACSIPQHNTTTTRFFQNVSIYRKNNIKGFKIHTED